MLDPEVFDRRLEKLEVVLRDLRGLGGLTAEQYVTDRGTQAKAERWVQVAVEACIDLASHMIADHGLPTPATYRAAFETLAGAGLLEPELATQMAGWAGLRNLLVHLYLDVDHRRLHEIVTGELDQLDAFAAAMARAR